MGALHDAAEDAPPAHDAHDYVRRRSLQQDDPSDPDSLPDGVPPLIMFVFCFFTVWNMIICLHTVKACTGLFRGECNESTPALFCPHWIVGIAIPMYVGYSWYGIGGLFFCAIPFLVPHAIGVIWLRYKERREEAARLAAMENLASTFAAAEQGGREVLDPNDPNFFSGMSTEERMEYMDKMIITKKVVSGSGSRVGSGGMEENLRSSSMAASFRSRNPKMDLVVAPGSTIADEVFASVQREGGGEGKGEAEHGDEAGSARICSICLDEYHLDEDICWSRNPECSHVFHKSCLMDWLRTDTSCPNCRKSYLGDFCRELSGSETT